MAKLNYSFLDSFLAGNVFRKNIGREKFIEKNTDEIAKKYKL